VNNINFILLDESKFVLEDIPRDIIPYGCIKPPITSKNKFDET
jgi:hypothetical protein